MCNIVAVYLNQVESKLSSYKLEASSFQFSHEERTTQKWLQEQGLLNFSCK